MIIEQFVSTTAGGILYDASQLRNPSEQVFDREFWRGQNALTELSGGRGTVAFVGAAEGEWVLRHYRRGGWAAKVAQDGYLWTGADRTRSFAEWRLLAELHRRELPVPRPIAARFTRSGLHYRADLITERITAAQTLARAVAGSTVSESAWRAVGRTVATFHAHGVHHADLNANNILLRADLDVYLLDFDRGRLRARGSWEQRVLARLRRSLEKEARKHASSQFGDAQWQWLMQGYGHHPK